MTEINVTSRPASARSSDSAAPTRQHCSGTRWKSGGEGRWGSFLASRSVAIRLDRLRRDEPLQPAATGRYAGPALDVEVDDGEARCREFAAQPRQPILVAVADQLVGEVLEARIMANKYQRTDA